MDDSVDGAYKKVSEKYEKIARTAHSPSDAPESPDSRSRRIGRQRTPPDGIAGVKIRLDADVKQWRGRNRGNDILTIVVAGKPASNRYSHACSLLPP